MCPGKRPFTGEKVHVKEVEYTIFICYSSMRSYKNKQLIYTLFLLSDCLIKKILECFMIIQLRKDTHTVQPKDDF